jgi:hypothetical protein
MKRVIFSGLAISLFIAIIISPFACGWHDGLERVAVDNGFEEAAVEEPHLAAPLPDYAIPGFKNEILSTALAGAIGTLLCFGAVSGTVILLIFRREK